MGKGKGSGVAENVSFQFRLGSENLRFPLLESGGEAWVVAWPGRRNRWRAGRSWKREFSVPARLGKLTFPATFGVRGFPTSGFEHFSAGQQSRRVHRTRPTAGLDAGVA